MSDNVMGFFGNEREHAFTSGINIMSWEHAKHSDLLHIYNGEKEIVMWVSKAFEIDHATGKKHKPKGNFTGGLEQVTMIRETAVLRLLDDFKNGLLKGNVIQQLGIIVLLTHFADFTTGRLMNRKKKEPLTRSDIANLLGVSERSVIRFLSNAKFNGLIERDNGAYCITRKIFKKGAKG